MKRKVWANVVYFPNFYYFPKFRYDFFENEDFEAYYKHNTRAAKIEVFKI